MDVVITYVDGNDPLWKSDYAKYSDTPVLEKRFRDWGTLKYLLRGIEKHMHFVQNVFLVVSHESQVPQWVDKTAVRVVLHKDFIPQELLPTFNCNPIEMHLHNIEGLGEEYIYISMMTCSRLQIQDLRISIEMARECWDSADICLHVVCSSRSAAILT